MPDQLQYQMLHITFVFLREMLEQSTTELDATIQDLKAKLESIDNDEEGNCIYM